MALHVTYGYLLAFLILTQFKMRVLLDHSQCTPYVATKGFILPSSVWMTVTVSSASGCVQQCSRTETCLSCNYYTAGSIGQSQGNCELNYRKALTEAVLTQHQNGIYYTYNKTLKDCNGFVGAGGATISIDSYGEKTVYCEEGWVVMMRRYNDAVAFNRTWDDYKKGFGDANGQFWLGNDALHALTNQGDYSMHLDMLSCDGNTYYFSWDLFRIMDESHFYKIAAIHPESHNTSQNLVGMNGWRFGTPDNDVNPYWDPTYGCGAEFGGGWWYYGCTQWQLTGSYPDCDTGTVYSMKFRPVSGTNCDKGCLLQAATLKIRRNA